MIRIVIADDHTIMREGLKHILDEADDIKVVAEAEDGDETMMQVSKGNCDLLLLDLSMPRSSGIELILQIKEKMPRLPILILTMYEEKQYAIPALRAGASGYLTKESASTQLLIAIRRVACGRPYISYEMAMQLAMDMMPTKKRLPHMEFSNREFEVFRQLVSGKSSIEIAKNLQLSAKTVSTYKFRILDKMEMRSLAEMVQYAVKYQLLPLTI
jgi:DNA-binding NarL/FixJ family response regulator